MNLTETANYRVAFDEREIKVTGITYDRDDAQKVVLTLAEPLQNGSCLVEGINLTDFSMEKNPLSDGILLKVSGIKQEDSAKPDAVDYRGVLSLMVLSLIALIIVVIVLIRQKSSHHRSGSLNNQNSHQYIDVPKKK